jgi:hypothetical protein
MRAATTATSTRALLHEPIFFYPHAQLQQITIPQALCKPGLNQFENLMVTVGDVKANLLGLRVGLSFDALGKMLRMMQMPATTSAFGWENVQT